MSNVTYLSRESAIIDCPRCGYRKEVHPSSFHKQVKMDAIRATLCLPCRTQEDARQRTTYVPADVLAQIVADMKAGK